MKFFKSIGNFISNIFKSLKDNTFLKDGLSIDETKVSAMIISFLITIFFALFMYYFHGDITINLLNLLSYLIFGITGVNVIDKVVSKIGNNNSNNIIIPIENPIITPTIQNTVDNISNGVNIPIKVDNSQMP